RVERLDGPIAEAMHDFQLELFAIEASENRPAAFCAEIKSEQFLGGGHGACFPRRGELEHRPWYFNESGSASGSSRVALSLRREECDYRLDGERAFRQGDAMPSS